MKINNILMLMLIMLSFGLYGCASQSADNANTEAQPTEEVAEEGTTEEGTMTDEDMIEEVEEQEVLVEEMYQPIVNDLFNGGIVTLYFDFDRSELRGENVKQLNGITPALVAYLGENLDSHIQLDGHADNRGSRSYNQTLGMRRSSSVSRHLRASNIDADRINAISYGEDSPAVQSNNEDAWAANRRVELYFKNN